MKLTINYKNGNNITSEVNYVHVEDGKIFYTIKKKIGPAVQEQVVTHIENIESYEVNEEC